MPRVKGGSASDKKRKKLFSITKGYWGRKKNVYRRAREAYLHSLSRAYVDRKRKKRDFRRLWITRINAATRSCGMSYSAFMNGLKKSGILINRKMLSELAINDMAAFPVDGSSKERTGQVDQRL
ncbi:MAG TPA: 50S ribosomal protein L20 [Synergistales bacterium]|nr:50S ribosomal protein L20 [Synergistales bacterium]